MSEFSEALATAEAGVRDAEVERGAAKKEYASAREAWYAAGRPTSGSVYDYVVTTQKAYDDATQAVKDARAQVDWTYAFYSKDNHNPYDTPPDSPIPADKSKNVQSIEELKENGTIIPGSKLADFDPLKSVAHYEFDYYSGAQVQIFFSDVWIDDINFLEVNVEHPHIPVYGYASKLYNTTTPGRKLVTGSFRINFKEAYYLHLVFEALKKRGSLGDMQSKLKRQQDQTKAAISAKGGLNAWIRADDLHAASTIHSRYNAKKAIDDKVLASNTVEDVLATMTKEGADKKAKNPSFNGETGVADTLGVIQPSEFDNYNQLFDAQAEAMEDQNWGVPGDANPPAVDSYGPFDIYLVFGDYNNQLANHTVRRLFYVELQSTTQQLEISGMPTQEAYTFIARDFR